MMMKIRDDGEFVIGNIYLFRKLLGFSFFFLKFKVAWLIFFKWFCLAICIFVEYHV
jgi:hypothetical protein